MKIKYASDIHLEINNSIPDFIKGESGEVLILAGDTIPNNILRKERTDKQSRNLQELFSTFVEQISGFDKVFILGGNHEHYRGHFQLMAVLYRKWLYDVMGKSKDQFMVLDNDLHLLDRDTVLVGATLWTDMRRDNPMAHQLVSGGMNDFRLITYGDNFDIFTTYDAMNEHKKSLAFIKAVAVENAHKRVIVATHHAPSYQSNGRENNGSTIIDGYCSNLEDFVLEHENISDWIHGHTHVDVDYHIGQCQVRSHMRGYEKYGDGKYFNAEEFNAKYIEI